MCHHISYDERTDSIIVIATKEEAFILEDDSLSQQHVQQFNQNVEANPNTKFKVTDLIKPSHCIF